MKQQNFFLLCLFLLPTTPNALAQYVYQQPSKHKSEKKEYDPVFEIGVHCGPTWATGRAKDFTKSGGSVSLDFSLSDERWLLGTEFSLTAWRDFENNSELIEPAFNEVNFLWLVHSKYYLTRGKERPYIGAGTDLISLFLALIDAEYEEEHEGSSYNAWVVPSVGIRWQMKENLSGNIGLSLNSSDKYTYLRLQLGVIF